MCPERTSTEVLAWLPLPSGSWEEQTNRLNAPSPSPSRPALSPLPGPQLRAFPFSRPNAVAYHSAFQIPAILLNNLHSLESAHRAVSTLTFVGSFSGNRSKLYFRTLTAAGLGVALSASCLHTGFWKRTSPPSPYHGHF